ncbi:MAG TPA: DUF4886 domain-containing protein [Ruminococcaceae bacterium]|nr:DUF4886 domain-containing protein [Oscillospiraceae bacterium]
MKPIKLLAIGNSFSVDAVEYLRNIALSEGVNILIGNLYIGGCPLERHWNNAMQDSHDYCYYRFAEETTATNDAGLLETIKSEEWDYITLQQASYASGQFETYEPYLTRLSAFVKENAPQAEQLIHQTWAYEIDSDHGGFASYGNDQKTMFKCLKDAYGRAAELLHARTIPCGEAVQLARSTALFDYANGGKPLNRDGFHASIPHGRYLLGIVWYETLIGKPLVGTYRPDDHCNPISQSEAEILRKCAHQAVTMYR